MEEINQDVLETIAMDIFKEIRQVEVSVSNNIKLLKRELIQTKYYRKFNLKTKDGSVILRNVFITVEKDKNEKISYHFRWLEKKLSFIEENIIVENGMVYTSSELKDIIGNIKINIEEIIQENDNRKDALKGISERLTLEQTKKIFTNEKEDVFQIEEDLAKQGQKVKIGKHIQIKNNIINELVPEIFEKGKRYEVAEDKESGNYIIIEKDKGYFKKNEEVQPGRFTIKRIFAIDTEEEEQKEFEILDQIMDVENYSTKKISIRRDEDGQPHIQIVQVTSCQNINR